MKQPPPKPITFRPSSRHPDLGGKLKQIARQQNRTMNNLMETILVDYLGKTKNPEK